MNIKFICMSFGKRKKSDRRESFPFLFRGKYKYILYFPTLYVYCVYTVMSCMHKHFFYHNQSRFLIFNCAT